MARNEGLYASAHLRLEGAAVRVVGAGPDADRVISELSAAGASVRRLGADAAGREDDGPAPEAVSDARLLEAQLIVAACTSAVADRWVVRRARALGRPVACLADPAAGTVDLGIAVNAGSASISVAGPPAALREDLLRRVVPGIPARYQRLVDWVRARQSRVASATGEPAEAMRFWRRLFTGNLPERVFNGHEREADEALDDALAAPAAVHRGEVCLIGAGPGDPELLTLKAVRLLQRADVVLHDRLVAPAVMGLVRADAERIYVGKQRDRHTVPQERINDLLVEHARRGLCVARVKGGDPFIFGRGGEEIDSLMRRGIPFQVVPGVTAASGCAAYAGIPLTHRDHAQSCVFVTGHRKANGELALDFDRLVRPAQTVVFYMGLQGLAQLCDGLVAHGMSPQMPAALVQQGTTENQRVVSATVATLAARSAAAGVRAPTLVIVGEVVRLRERLGWFTPESGAHAQTGGWS